MRRYQPNFKKRCPVKPGMTSMIRMPVKPGMIRMSVKPGMTGCYDLLDQPQQLRKVVDDPGCVGEAFAGAVAVGYAAGAGAGVAAHVDVEDCVADYDGLLGLEAEFLQGHIHGFRMGFAVADVVAAEDVGYGGGEVEVGDVCVKGGVAPAAGDGEGDAAALEFMKGLEDVRVEDDGARGVKDIEDPAVGLGVEVAVYLDLREEDGRDLGQAEADHRGAFCVGARGEAEFLDGGLGGSDDDVGGVTEGAVEVEYDDFCAHVLISLYIHIYHFSIANAVS